MKTSIFLSLLTVLFFFSCERESKVLETTVSISAEISNSDENSIRIFSRAERKSLDLKNGIADGDIHVLGQSVIAIRHSRDLWYCYAEPGNDIKISFDAEDSKIYNFSGDYANENKFLTTTLLKYDELMGNRSEYFAKPENEFLSHLAHVRNSIEKDIVQFNNSNPNADQGFMESLSREINYNNAAKLWDYENGYRRYSEDTSYIVSNELEKLKAASIIENQEFLGSDAYCRLLLRVVGSRANKVVDEDKSEKEPWEKWRKARYQVINESFKDPGIKEYCNFYFMNNEIRRTGGFDRKEVIDGFINGVSNEVYAN
ncbi:MAG: hypothetical protein HKN67_03865, partial [Saprospiraceae bacterium]|nr:hypothetical protein [Saprospiraceae bacterium]